MTLKTSTVHFTSILTNHRERQQAISIRFPAELQTVDPHLARGPGVAYQTLIKHSWSVM